MLGKKTKTPINIDKTRGDCTILYGPYYPDTKYTKVVMYCGPNPLPTGANVMMGDGDNTPRSVRLRAYLEFLAQNSLIYEREHSDGTIRSIIDEVEEDIRKLEADGK